MDSVTRSEASVIRNLDKRLSYQEFDNAFVLPSKDLWKEGKCYGGVVTADGSFVESSAWHEGQRCDKYFFFVSEAVHRDDIVIFMGFYNPCWGHAITDNLKKMWFLETEVCKELLFKGAKLIYLTIDNTTIPTYVNRLFELAGVQVSCFELINQLSQFKRVIIPDNSFIADSGQRYFTREFVATINKIKNNFCCINGDYYDKIYFTRTQLKSGRDIGEESIEKLFKKNGYEIIAPEKLTVDQQICLLYNCKYFAATEGSISHNALFCQSGTNVIIVRKCNDVNKYQMACNEIADVNVTYIDAHHSTRTLQATPWCGPFFLYDNNLIHRYFSSGLFLLPYWMRLGWWKYMLTDLCLYRRMKILYCRLVESINMMCVFHN